MRNSSTRPSSIVPRLDPLGRPHCQPDLIAPVMLDFDGPVTYLFINGRNRMVADQMAISQRGHQLPDIEQHIDGTRDGAAVTAAPGRSAGLRGIDHGLFEPVYGQAADVHWRRTG